MGTGKSIAWWAALALLAALGCRMDMHDQPKLEPLEANAFFANGMASQPLPEGTVARGTLREDSHLYTGKGEDGELASELPMPLTRALLLRGQERYEIFCSVCHDSTGGGRGMIVLRGFKQPPPFAEERLLAMPVGHFYDVMTRGFGVMSSYAQRIPVEDRWAIAAYIRALQFSQTRPIDQLPAAMRQDLESALAHGDDDGGGHADHG